MEKDSLLNSLSVEEKAKLVQGTNFMYTNKIERLGINSLRMSDGPHGLRVQNNGGDNGVTGSEVATAFPTAACVSSSWNPNNSYLIGKAMGEEAKYYGIHIILGPGTNIKRNPLGGRNFEYFSEDPLLSGKFAAKEIEGIQEEGVGSSIKHFACNNSENYRFMGNSIIDERALREIYLKPFEIAIKEAKPYTVMNAYNAINSSYCSQNKWLLTDVLRNEWGFKGLVMTDWGASHDRKKMLEAGCSLEMPGDTKICNKWIIEGIDNGSLKKEDLDKNVSDVLNLVERFKDYKKTDTPNFEKHNELAYEVACDSAVLLKNDNNVLPLKENDDICILGDLFSKMRYQGSGSSMINPTKIVTPKEAFDSHHIKYEFVRGYKENSGDVDELLQKEAIEKASTHSKILLFLGLTDFYESEGADRENMSLPKNQIELAKEICKLGKDIIVILYLGSPVELSFFDDVKGVLNMYLPGQAGGLATYSLLYGEKNPSGKLAESWPISYQDVPSYETFSKSINEVYKESVFVGYRYYSSFNKSVRFPFGFGLSYTKFAYSNSRIEDLEKTVKLIFEIQNIGDVAGAEVAEIYVSSPKGSIFRPLKELKAFQKVYLAKDEKKEISIEIPKDDLRYYDIKEKRWILSDGEYDFLISSSSEKVELSEKLLLVGETKSPYSRNVIDIYSSIAGDKVDDKIFEEMSGIKISPLPKKKPITLESRFSSLKDSSLLGKILYKAVLSVANKQLKEASKLPDSPERDNKLKGAIFLQRVLNSNSLISMSMCSALFPYNLAEGFMHFANNRFFKGIKAFLTPVKIKTPKEKRK